jgi:hypothetical protein
LADAAGLQIHEIARAEDAGDTHRFQHVDLAVTEDLHDGVESTTFLPASISFFSLSIEHQEVEVGAGADFVGGEVDGPDLEGGFAQGADVEDGLGAAAGVQAAGEPEVDGFGRWGWAFEGPAHIGERVARGGHRPVMLL